MAQLHGQSLESVYLSTCHNDVQKLLMVVNGRTHLYLTPLRTKAATSRWQPLENMLLFFQQCISSVAFHYFAQIAQRIVKILWVGNTAEIYENIVAFITECIPIINPIAVCSVKFVRIIFWGPWIVQNVTHSIKYFIKWINKWPAVGRTSKAWSPLDFYPKVEYLLQIMQKCIQQSSWCSHLTR